MSKLLVERLTETKEGLRKYQQERTIVQITELICEVMDKSGISRSDLAKRLKKTKGFVSQLLDGEANMTIRTVSDVLTAMGVELTVTTSPLRVHSDAAAEAETEVGSSPRVAACADWDTHSVVDISHSGRPIYTVEDSCPQLDPMKLAV